MAMVFPFQLWALFQTGPRSLGTAADRSISHRLSPGCRMKSRVSRRLSRPIFTFVRLINHDKPMVISEAGLKRWWCSKSVFNTVLIDWAPGWSNREFVSYLTALEKFRLSCQKPKYVIANEDKQTELDQTRFSCIIVSLHLPKTQ